MQKLRDIIGLFLLGLGMMGCLLPIIPGIPFLIGAVALLGPNHPRLKPWINRIAKLPALMRKTQSQGTAETHSDAGSVVTTQSQLVSEIYGQIIKPWNHNKDTTEDIMQRLSFSISINAPKEQVWRTMLADTTYRQWTSAFEEGSYAVTDWTAGSKALFLTPSGNGMVSKIVAHRPNEFLSIKHLGTMKHGVEETEGPEAKSWNGSFENYTLREVDGASTLTVEMDVTDEYKNYFEETWPKALSKLKQISEAQKASGLEKLRQSA